MDITFQTDGGTFNCRACAVMIRDHKILAMKDEYSTYFYLPGGRVKLNETAEHAVLREIKEELKIDAVIQRPLWLNQGFFIQDENGKKYHELCFYFLIGIDKTDLTEKGDCFTVWENGHQNHFQWIPFEQLENEYIYPNFIKKGIFELPKALTLREEKEY